MRFILRGNQALGVLTGSIFEVVEEPRKVTLAFMVSLVALPPKKHCLAEVLLTNFTIEWIVALDEWFKIFNVSFFLVTQLNSGLQVAIRRDKTLGIRVSSSAQAAKADGTAHFSSLSALVASPLAAAVFAASLSFSSLISENLRIFSKKSGPLWRVMSSLAFLLLSVRFPAP